MSILRPNNISLRISLRMLLIATIPLCIFLAMYGREIARRAQQQLVVERIESVGGVVMYEHDINLAFGQRPNRFRLLGEAPYVVRVTLDDAVANPQSQLERLNELPYLRTVALSRSGFTNDHIQQLSHLIPNSKVLYSDPLIVLDGSNNLTRHQSGFNGSEHISYGINREHPASETIQEISSRLSALGWAPLSNHWLNPGRPSSHVDGWREFVAGPRTQMRCVHVWQAQWQDKSSNIVDYCFTYSYAESGDPDLQSLWIDGSWYPAVVNVVQMPLR